MKHDLVVLCEHPEWQKPLWAALERRGVRYAADGQGRTVAANREVLLCAGALQSPKILQLSGIGPPELLREFAIGVRAHFPEWEAICRTICT